jgi:Tfp pilus assembly protein PilF
MDALKKAEQAKRDAQGGTTTPTAEAVAEGLSLTPLETPVPDEPLAPLPFNVPPQPAPADLDTGTAAGATRSTVPTTGLRLDTPVDFSRSSTARAPAYPDLSAAMSVPDSDFLDIARIPPPARDRTTEIKETPSSRVRVEPQLAPAAKTEVRREVPPRAATPVPNTATADTAPTKPVAAKSKAVDADRDAASNVFAAKEAGKKPGGNKAFAIIVGIATIAATAGIGGYFWWQLQPKGMSAAAPLANLPNQAVARLPAPAPGLATPVPPPAAATAATTPATANSLTEGAPIAAPSAAAVPSAPTIATTTPPTAATAKATVRKVIAEQEDLDSPIRVTRNHLQVNPILGRGYDALNRGDLAVASSNYAGVLKADPKNTDALHGMAAIALRENQSTQAEQWFKQILVANPKDEAALSGLIEIYSKANPAAAESRLKAIIAEHADATSPQVALGNLYSAQQRWQEAQQAYFAAYATQPDNPDVLFNLAISLEHLRQPRLARQYYTEALQAARRNPSRFDTSVAEDRLRALAAQ